MATPAELRAAAAYAKTLAEAGRILAFVTNATDPAAAARFNIEADTVLKFEGYANLAAGSLETPAPAPKPPAPTGTVTDAQARNAVKKAINHGGEWGGRAVWQERMGRPSFAELKYMPATNSYNVYKNISTPEVTWDQWVKSAKDFADRMAGDPNPPRLILGVPPWPIRNGKWGDAANGTYDGPWTSFWNEWKRVPEDRRHKLIIRFWEFTGAHYLWHITEGGLYESGTIDPGKAKNMATAVRRFFDMGRRICGDKLPQYDHNMGGSISDAALEYGWPGDDYVDRLTIDRYVNAGDVADIKRWTNDLDKLFAAAEAHNCQPGISEGSIYQDKTKDGKQLGGRDSQGALNCALELDKRLFARAKAGKPLGDIMFFERDPRPEGYFAMFTLGAPGTYSKQGDGNYTVNGRNYPTHCPVVLKGVTPLWVGPIT